MQKELDSLQSHVDWIWILYTEHSALAIYV